jgi:predicted restriction endonuclease
MASFILCFMNPTTEDMLYGMQDNFQYLCSNFKDGVEWTVSKNAKQGNQVFFYCAADANNRMGRVISELKQYGDNLIVERAKTIRENYKNYHGKIIATGRLSSDAQYDERDEKYYAFIGKIVLLDNPVEYAEFKGIQRINSFGSITYLKNEVYKKIFQLVVNNNPEQFKDAPIRPQPFKEQVFEASKLSDEKLKKIAESKSVKHVLQKVSTVTYRRDPYIAVYAKRRANGHCDLCGASAPFKDRKGEPYLECHHVEWLSCGGEDSIDNVVALCPNCHRRIHVLNDADDNMRLKKKLKLYH